MKNSKQSLTNTFILLFSNLFRLFSGLLINIIIPKIISIEDFGYYKTFSLYANYVGIMHLGFVDGIYFKFCGQNYEDLDKKYFRSLFLYFFAFESILFIAALLFSLSISGKENKIIFCFISIYMYFYNLVTYFQYLSQALSNFSIISKQSLISSIINLICIVFIYINKSKISYVDFKIFIFLIIFTTMISLFIYIYVYKDLIFGEKSKINILEFYKYVLYGLPILTSGLLTILIQTLDKQVINIIFDINTYGIYSFSYNLVSLVTVVSSSLKVIVYPKYKKYMLSDKQDLSKISSSIIILLLTFLLTYYPISYFIKWFLPKYTVSLDYFKTVLPISILLALIEINLHNLFVILNKEKEYLLLLIEIFILSLIGDFAICLIFKTPQSILYVYTLIVYIWYIKANKILNKYIHFSFIKNLIYITILFFIFYLFSSISNQILGFSINIVLFIFFTFIMYKGILIKRN